MKNFIEYITRNKFPFSLACLILLILAFDIYFDTAKMKSQGWTYEKIKSTFTTEQFKNIIPDPKSLNIDLQKNYHYEYHVDGKKYYISHNKKFIDNLIKYNRNNPKEAVISQHKLNLKISLASTTLKFVLITILFAWRIQKDRKNKKTSEAKNNQLNGTVS